MRGKSTVLVIAAIATLSLCGSINAQQQETTQHPQDFATAFAKAHAACMALLADHALDPLRDKFPWEGQKPTFAMLTDRTRLLPKDRPLADLAIKTIEKCRALQADAIALLPQQTQQRLQSFDREVDSLNAQLYVGKITIGEYNVGLNRILADQSKAFFGDAHAESSDGGPKQASTETRGTKQSVVQQQAQSVTSQSAISHQTRLALVIGNSNYTDLPKLKNPANDAHAVVDALRAVGFDVMLVTDASETNIRRAVRKFSDQSDQADVALVYYAGHGAQVNGENYLLPVDMEIPQTEADIELSSLKLDDLVNSIRSPTKIVFLDACRDNPALFKNLVKGRGAIATGLAPTDASHLTRLKPGEGVFIAYATQAGSVALEGDGEHSPFTEALLRNVKKPISIDDMFSLVTREVALVTKGMQRPYKYASLENIVCLTGTCSDTTPAPATDVVQEARRSASDELQVALQTNNPDALQTYLEKYPESSERQKVLAEIGRLKRSEFNEWTFFEVSNGHFPQYIKLSSIQQFGDRVAVQTRGLADLRMPLIGTKTFPDGTYDESTSVFDCKQSIVGISERKAVSPSGEILDRYKQADPEVFNLSFGTFIASGTVAATLKNFLCDDRLRTPLVSKKQLAPKDFTDLATTPAGDGELYYRPVPNGSASQTEKDVIVLIKQFTAPKVASQIPFPIPPGLSEELGDFRTVVYSEQIRCEERKVSILKTEVYDASNVLKFIFAADLTKEKLWTEFKENTPLETLQRTLCKSREVQQ